MSAWRIWVPAGALVTKGGGFGMFATTDGTAFRHVRVFVEAPDRSEEIVIAPSLENAASRAGLFPSERLLTELAEAVLVREYKNGRRVDAVRIEVLGVEFKQETLQASERRLRSFVLTVPHHGPE